MALVELTQGTAAARWYRAGTALVIAAVLIYLPWFADNPARIDQFTQVCAFAVALVGLNLIVGYTGQISLGHSAFVGLGAYTTLVLVIDHGWGYLTTIPVVIVVSFAAGVVVGLPALRISGLYMAVVTLAVAVVFPSIVVKVDSVTNGANGLLATDRMMPPSWVPLDADTRFGPVAYRYYVALLVAVLLFIVAYNFVRGRFGRSIIAMRDNHTAAAVSGVHLGLVRTLTFGLSAAFGGVAGTLLMIQLPQATPSRFTLDMALFLLVSLFAGGTTSLSGSVPAALLYVFLPYYAIEWGTQLELVEGPGAASISGIVYGVLLIGCAFLLRGGVAEGFHRLWSRLVHVRPAPRWLRRMAPRTSTASKVPVSSAHP